MNYEPGLVLEDLPQKLQTFLRNHKVDVYTVPHIESTSEKVRERRERFGGFQLFTAALASLQGKFAIVRKDDRWGRGWTIPGGAVEKEEEIEKATVREVKEESGLDIALVRPVALVRSRIVAPTGLGIDYYLVTFYAGVVGGDLRPLDQYEIAESGLATMNEIEELISKGRFPSIHPHLDQPVIESIREMACS